MSRGSPFPYSQTSNTGKLEPNAKLDSSSVTTRRDRGVLRAHAIQPQPEARAAARRVLERHRSAVRLGHLFHDRESQPRARQVARARRAPEAIEDPRAG